MTRPQDPAGVYGVLTNATFPEWAAQLTLGEVVAWSAGIAAAIAALLPAIRGIIRVVRATTIFLNDWNGTEERRDRSGRLIEKGQPGIPALLETVRAQVQNSHQTNLRDDMDSISNKLDEHIAICKYQEQQQRNTSRKLEEHVEETERWHEMLEDLHRQWAVHTRTKPPDPRSDD